MICDREQCREAYRALIVYQWMEKQTRSSGLKNRLGKKIVSLKKEIRMYSGKHENPEN